MAKFGLVAVQRIHNYWNNDNCNNILLEDLQQYLMS